MSKRRAPFAVRVALLWMGIACVVVMADIPAPSLGRVFFAAISLVFISLFVWESSTTNQDSAPTSAHEHKQVAVWIAKK